MATIPSNDDLVGLGRAALEMARPQLEIDEGDIAEQTAAGSAAMGEAIIALVVQLYRETFLEGVSGARLDERILDRHNLPRLEASKATVELTFARSSAAAGAGVIEAGTRRATVPDSEGNRFEFETLADVVWGEAEVGSKTVQARATEAGAANVLPGTITEQVDELFDPSITSTNAARAAGGAEEESDEAYRARARAYPLTLGKGTLPALEFGSRQVSGVRVATATEDASGRVTVYVADAAGASTPAMAAAVKAELDARWRAAGASVVVAGGEVEEYALEIEIDTRDGNAADFADAIAQATTAEAARLGAGETLHLARLVTATINVDPRNIRNARILSPPADVVPSATTKIIRVAGVTVTEA